MVNSQILTGEQTRFVTNNEKNFIKQSLFFPAGVKKQSQIVHGIGIGNRKRQVKTHRGQEDASEFGLFYANRTLSSFFPPRGNVPFHIWLRIQELTSLAGLPCHCLQVLLVYFTQVYIDLSTRFLSRIFFFCTLLEVWPRLILRFDCFSDFSVSTEHNLFNSLF